MVFSEKPSLVIYLPDLIGGGVPHLYIGLAPYFKGAGFDVTFLVDRLRGDLIDTVPTSIPVVELGVSRQLVAPPKLALYLRKHRPDLILTAIEQMHVMVAIALRISRVPTRHIVTQHNPLSEQAKRPGRQFTSLPFLYRTIVSRADAIVAVSKGVGDDLAARAPMKRDLVEVIYNGAIRASFEDELSKPISLPTPATDELTVLTVGRLAVQKDYATLIRAFAIVRKTRNVRLVIIGDGPLRNELEALARELGVADQVLMPGFSKHPLSAMKAADVFVLSSRYEGLGLVLIEALACGTPVVSTDCPFGPSEILEGGRYGRLVPIEDPEALAIAIAETLRDPSDRAALAARGRSFSMDGCAAAYLNLFQRLLTKQPR